MKISTPEIKVIRFSSEDVIVASSSLTGVYGSFYIPSSQYSSGYAEFNGTIGSKSDHGYLIENASDPKPADSDERDGLMSGGSVSFVGFPIPTSVMEKMAKQYYDAFLYDDGQYYTYGRSYYDQYWNQ